MTIKKRTRILSEHNSDGTHNSVASSTLSIQLTKYYESAEQTITAAGSLQLAHSLEAKPLLIQCLLVCKTTEHNYSVDDEVFISSQVGGAYDTTSKGVSIVPDSTNLNIRYGSDANVFNVPNKTTGVLQVITIANWKFVVRAWA